MCTVIKWSFKQISSNPSDLDPIYLYVYRIDIQNVTVNILNSFFFGKLSISNSEFVPLVQTVSKIYPIPNFLGYWFEIDTSNKNLPSVFWIQLDRNNIPQKGYFENPIVDIYTDINKSDIPPSVFPRDKCIDFIPIVPAPIVLNPLSFFKKYFKVIIFLLILLFLIILFFIFRK